MGDNISLHDIVFDENGTSLFYNKLTECLDKTKVVTRFFELIGAVTPEKKDRLLQELLNNNTSNGPLSTKSTPFASFGTLTVEESEQISKKMRFFTND